MCEKGAFGEPRTFLSMEQQLSNWGGNTVCVCLCLNGDLRRGCDGTFSRGAISFPKINAALFAHSEGLCCGGLSSIPRVVVDGSSLTFD